MANKDLSNRQWYRLHVNMSKNSGVGCSMFALRDICSEPVLIQGNHWGDDYLLVPSDEQEKQVLEELMSENAWAIDIKDQLPVHLRYAI